MTRSAVKIPIIDRSTFHLTGTHREIDDSGTVEVAVSGETRRVNCTADDCGTIYVQNLYGRFGRSARWWSLQAISRPDGAEEFRIHEHPAPSRLLGRVPDEIRFMSRELLRQEGGGA